MVRGLNTFRAHFAAHSGKYTLIGGAAASEWFDRAGLNFRATRDLDVVLIVETIDADFLRTFWSFVELGGYTAWQRSDGSRAYYRFSNPTRPDYPSTLELFSRQPDGLLLFEDQRIIPISMQDDVSSLSAILMDDDYYSVVTAFREEVEGLSMLSPAGIILLKVRAWIDLSQRPEAERAGRSKEIRKHRNDVFRLTSLLPIGVRFDAPATVSDDVTRFIVSFPPTSPEWTEIAAAVQSTGMRIDPLDALRVLGEAFIHA